MFYGFLREKRHIWANFKKRWFNPFKVQYCLPDNIVIIVLVNNFELNPVLVNVNKLKLYKYLDQTLKGIQSLEDQESLKSIDSDDMEEKIDEDSEDQSKTNIIGTHHTIIFLKT